jgi:hypothetical protein
MCGAFGKGVLKASGLCAHCERNPRPRVPPSSGLAPAEGEARAAPPANSAPAVSTRYQVLYEDVHVYVYEGVHSSAFYDAPLELSAKVNAAIDAGASLAGGLSTTVLSRHGGNFTVRYAQAVLYPAMPAMGAAGGGAAAVAASAGGPI